MKHLTLIATDIELDANENDFLYNIYYSHDTGIFIAICTDDVSSIFGYQLEEDIQTIFNRDREEILNCCLGLGNYPKSEPITAKDVFMLGDKYLKPIF